LENHSEKQQTFKKTQKMRTRENNRKRKGNRKIAHAEKKLKKKCHHEKAGGLLARKTCKIGK
jgi:hypothetical protein